VSPDASERLTVAEAARRLGVSQDAVRKRIKRDTIGYVRHDDGRVYVYLDPSETPQATDQVGVQDRTDALIAELQDRVRSLEEANRENRRIIAALTQRIPEIEAPRESPTPSDSPGPTPTPTEASGEPQEPTARPWWRRIFE
jgi:excisionase family DNA binding protein